MELLVRVNVKMFAMLPLPGGPEQETCSGRLPMAPDARPGAGSIGGGGWRSQMLVGCSDHAWEVAGRLRCHQRLDRHIASP